MLKQGLHQADGKTYEEFARRVAEIHRGLLDQFVKEGRAVR
jgi:hypothetical protein